MYKCKICGAECNYPRVHTASLVMDADGNREPRQEVTCPECGSGRIEDVSAVPEIALRFRDFLAEYEPDQIRALDDELDGISLVTYWRNH